MQVLERSDKKWVGNCEHYRLVRCDVLDSELTVLTPASPRHHPPGPVELLIRINYSLNFADSQNGTKRPLVMVKINDTCFVQDGNWDWFEISDWDFATSIEFAHKVGVDGTPTFLINGKLRPGAVDDETLTEAMKS